MTLIVLLNQLGLLWAKFLQSLLLKQLLLSQEFLVLLLNLQLLLLVELLSIFFLLLDQLLTSQEFALTLLVGSWVVEWNCALFEWKCLRRLQERILQLLESGRGSVELRALNQTTRLGLKVILGHEWTLRWELNLPVREEVLLWSNGELLLLD